MTAVPLRSEPDEYQMEYPSDLHHCTCVSQRLAFYLFFANRQLQHAVRRERRRGTEEWGGGRLRCNGATWNPDRCSPDPDQGPTELRFICCCPKTNGTRCMTDFAWRGYEI